MRILLLCSLMIKNKDTFLFLRLFFFPDITNRKLQETLKYFLRFENHINLNWRKKYNSSPYIVYLIFNQKWRFLELERHISIFNAWSLDTCLLLGSFFTNGVLSVSVFILREQQMEQQKEVFRYWFFSFLASPPRNSIRDRSKEKEYFITMFKFLFLKTREKQTGSPFFT